MSNDWNWTPQERIAIVQTNEEYLRKGFASLHAALENFDRVVPLNNPNEYHKQLDVIRFASAKLIHAVHEQDTADVLYAAVQVQRLERLAQERAHHEQEVFVTLPDGTRLTVAEMRARYEASLKERTLEIERTTSFKLGMIAGKTVYNHQKSGENVQPLLLATQAVQFAKCFNLTGHELSVFLIGFGYGYYEWEAHIHREIEQGRAQRE